MSGGVLGLREIRAPGALPALSPLQDDDDPGGVAPATERGVWEVQMWGPAEEGDGGVLDVLGRRQRQKEERMSDKSALTKAEYAAALIQRDREKRLRRAEKTVTDAGYADSLIEKVEVIDGQRYVTWEAPAHWSPQRKKRALDANKSRKDAPVYLQMAQEEIAAHRKAAESSGHGPAVAIQILLPAQQREPEQNVVIVTAPERSKGD